jgi:hypothetical protein
VAAFGHNKVQSLSEPVELDNPTKAVQLPFLQTGILLLSPVMEIMVTQEQSGYSPKAVVSGHNKVQRLLAQAQ